MGKGDGAHLRAAFAKWASRRTVTWGEMSASPLAAARTASTRRVGPASLRMKPLDVEQADVRVQFVGQLDRSLPVGGLGNDLDVARGFEDQPEADAHQLLVICD